MKRWYVFTTMMIGCAWVMFAVPGKGAETEHFHGVTHGATMPVHASVLPENFALEFPLDKSKWPDAGERALAASDVWGGRIDVRQVFQMGGRWVLFYGSRPAGGDRGRASLPASVAFSPDLIRWCDSPANPIFDVVEQPWQGSRARAEGLVYDEADGRWVLFFGGNGHQHMPGLRGVGVAYSNNLKDWTLDESNPLVTVATGDISNWGAGDNVVRVYPVGVHRHRNTWYMFIMAGGPMPGVYKAAYHIGILTADAPEGPWADTGNNPIVTRGAEGEWDWQGLFAAGGARFHNGRWIIAYANRFGKVGFALSDGEDPTSGWSKAPENPYIEGDEIRRSLMLVPTGDSWVLLYSALDPARGLDSGDPRELYIMRYGAEERAAFLIGDPGLASDGRHCP